MTINVSYLERIPQRDGGKYITYTLTDDQDIDNPIVIGPVYVKLGEDPVAKAQELKLMFNTVAKERELDKAAALVNTGEDISSYTWKYNTKRQVLQYIYDNKIVPTTDEALAKYTKWQVLKDKVYLFLTGA